MAADLQLSVWCGEESREERSRFACPIADWRSCRLSIVDQYQTVLACLPYHTFTPQGREVNAALRLAATSGASSEMERKT